MLIKIHFDPTINPHHEMRPTIDKLMGVADGDFYVQKYEIDKRIVISVNYCSTCGDY
jgi:hypothetical protein